MAAAEEPIIQTNPKAGYLAHRDEIDAAIKRALESGWYILGKEVEAFEQEFAAYLGLKQAVGLNSGTDALHLALRACGVGPGDGVITVSQTAVATVCAIELAGATPILVDIDPATFTMDPQRLEEAIERYSKEATVRLKAVVVVHLYGSPANMDAILPIARRHSLRVIEDCAQCHGALWHGTMTGTMGDIAAYSFYPTKNLAAIGDGGCVATNDESLATQVRLLAQYGWRERYISEIPGMNSRLDELQAAILRVRLRHLNSDNDHRRRIATGYDRGLANSGLTLPAEPKGCHHVYHQYVVRTPRRDDLRAHLKERGIGTLVHYPLPVHLQPAYRNVLLGQSTGLPHTEALYKEILSLPMYPQLTDEQVQRISREVSAWIE